MDSIAIIPARSGSKRIPLKNIKEFDKKPMIAHAIDIARQSKLFSEIMVSTDSEKIASIAELYGAKVPFFRSASTSGDYATTSEVIWEVIKKYEEGGRVFDWICCIYPCVPFLKVETLVKAREMLVSSEADGIKPVCRFPAPIEWSEKMDSENWLHPDNKKLFSIRSQDLIPRYYDAGMFYFLRGESFYKEKTITPEKELGIEVKENECQDIDTMDDWISAEIKYKCMKEMSLRGMRL